MALATLITMCRFCIMWGLLFCQIIVRHVYFHHPEPYLWTIPVHFVRFLLVQHLALDEPVQVILVAVGKSHIVKCGFCLPVIYEVVSPLNNLTFCIEHSNYTLSLIQPQRSAQNNQLCMSAFIYEEQSLYTPPRDSP